MNKLKLTMISRRLRKLREKQKAEKQKDLEEQLWEAWKARDFSRVHRVRSFLARSGHAPRQRRYWAPTQLIPSRAQWAAAVVRPGTEGGLEGEVREFNEHESIYKKEVADFNIEKAYDGVDMDRDVRHDWQNMIWALLRSKRRRAVPSWGVLSESLLLAMIPNRKHRFDKEVLQIDTTPLRLETPVFQSMFLDLLRKIRLWRLIPLAWMHCWSIGLSKPNNITNSATDLRLIHLFDSTSAA